MCCKLGEIPDFKPFNQWCQYCSTRHGCDIYPNRPQPCRDFFCHYLLSDLGEEWRPLTCGMVVSTYSGPQRLTVSVDPERPALWNASPYLEQIMHWATQGAVTVMVGHHAHAVYPDRVEDLGEIDEEFALVITEQVTPAGTRYLSRRLPRNQLS
jgi:hypothetical protein